MLVGWTRVKGGGGGNDCSTYEYYSFTAYDKEEDTTISKMTAIDEEKSTDIFEKAVHWRAPNSFARVARWRVHVT